MLVSQPLPVQELVIAKFGLDMRHPSKPDKGHDYSALLKAYVSKIKRQWKQDQRDKDRASTKSQGRGGCIGRPRRVSCGARRDPEPLATRVSASRLSGIAGGREGRLASSR